MPIPTVLPVELDEDAAKLYHRACKDYHTYMTLAEDELDAAAVIAAGGLGHVHTSGDTTSLRVYQMHPAFSVAHDESSPRHGLYVEVRLVDDDEDRTGGILLACLDGAHAHRVDKGQGRPRWRYTVRHTTGTDVDHDAMILADLTVIDPQLMSCAWAIEMVGTLAELRIWPAGVDPLAQSNPDTDAEMCESCDKPHPFGPYVPPSRPELHALAGRSVLLSIHQRVGVDASGHSLAPDDLDD